MNAALSPSSHPRRSFPQLYTGWLLLHVMLTGGFAWAQPAEPWAASTWRHPHPASLKILDGYNVLHLKGSPEDLGRQHGSLAGDLVRRVLHDVLVGDPPASEQSQQRLLEGAMVMERHLPDIYRRELRALAAAARVDYYSLVALQLFGDVNRAQQCSSYAAYGPATATGELIAGRNMDFWDSGASTYGAVILVYYPDQGLPFITISWAGVINGWTAMNACGVIVSNNTAWGGTDSLEGLSTCFVLRKVAQYARSVDDGVEIIQSTPRACGTVMMVAGGTPPLAAQVEFDHEQVAVRRAEDGWVIATNAFRKLYQGDAADHTWECSRYGRLQRLIQDNYGNIDRSMNFAASPGVPLTYINLHSALLFPSDLTIRVSMGQIPASEQRYRPFRFTPQGLVSLAQDR